MAGTTAAPTASGRLFGWIKAALATTVGLLSGAAMMYATTLVDTFVKPPAPVANFHAEVGENHKVTLHNRSTGGTEGWWDFGDGSALEPFAPDQPSVTHAYARPGVYTVKLTLKNFVKEANERSVSLTLDAEPAPPAVEEFTVTPVGAGAYAPATFRAAARFKNADLCLWALGDDHPLDLIADPMPTQERLVTFAKPGSYTVRFAVFNGKQLVERKQTVRVEKPAPGVTTAMVKVVYKAVQTVSKDTPPIPQTIDFPANHKEPTYKFSRDFSAPKGMTITRARLADAVSADLVKNAKVEVGKDGTKATLTGELVKKVGADPKAPLPKWVARVVLTEERQGLTVERPAQTTTVTLKVPGVTELDLPKVANGWVVRERLVNLELMREGNTVWQGAQMPKDASLTLNGQPHRLTATVTADRLRVEVTPGVGAVHGN